jgi:hypothetical protein
VGGIERSQTYALVRLVLSLLITVTDFALCISKLCQGYEDARGADTRAAKENIVDWLTHAPMKDVFPDGTILPPRKEKKELRGHAHRGISELLCPPKLDFSRYVTHNVTFDMC